MVYKAVEGGISPRWSHTGAPEDWMPEDALEWLSAHGFSKVAQVSRAASCAWYFRAWPDAQSGTAVYESGICVAAASQKSKRTRAAPPLRPPSGVAQLSPPLLSRLPSPLLLVLLMRAAIRS